ncbi:ComF family protein [Nocardia sp. NPDC004573]
MRPISPAADVLRQVVQERVGTTFHNTYVPGTLGICRVCRGPASDVDYCGACREHRTAYGSLLADKTILLTYAQGNLPGGKHQSAHEVRAYKEGVDLCRENLQLVIRSAVTLHHQCISAHLGWQWDSLTFVPSQQRNGREPPVSMLANAVLTKLTSPPIMPTKFLLDTGPGIVVRHALVNDRFIVPDRYRSAVEGKNVLIVDDTWTTGASMQGAAIAVKDAGARTVTALCFDRWLRWDWSEHAQLLKTLRNHYDPLACPINGDICSAAAQFVVPTASE